MEKELNIADILKDKLVGLKFYSPTFGCVTFNGVHKDKVYFFSDDTNAHSVKQNGKMYDGGECIIFPSKEMRDWSKFVWKMGDILVNKDGNAHVIFEGFDDDTYETFNGNNYLWKNEGITMCFGEYEDELPTSDFSKANKEDAQKYIHQIEKRLGYKLNLETLEIEKHPEFKDGDIVFMREVKSEFSANCIFILRGEYNGEGNALYHAFYNADDKFVYAEYGSTRVHYNLRPATDSEKQQLFDALAKKNKAWDAEKKQIVDLPKKCELKPFDKVLVRDSESDEWRANLFGYISEDGYYCCVFASWVYCIPYAGNDHLLGTTKDVEG